MKRSILFPLMLLCLHASSQTFVSGEAGTRLGINAGYVYKNITLKAGGLFFYKRDPAKSSIAYVGIGYQIGKEISITPFAGIAHYKVTDFKKYYAGGDPKEINKVGVLYSIEAGKDMTSGWGGSYRIYLFTTYSENVFYGAGLRIFIK